MPLRCKSTDYNRLIQIFRSQNDHEQVLYPVRGHFGYHKMTTNGTLTSFVVTLGLKGVWQVIENIKYYDISYFFPALKNRTNGVEEKYDFVLGLYGSYCVYDLYGKYFL